MSEILLTALFDASVLYSAASRDLLMHLAEAELFRARWTRVIHEEWMGSLLRDRPDLKREHLTRTRDLMNRAIMDCLVEEYEELIPELALPDPDDHHVLAAAIRSRSDVIVTLNLKDFPSAALRQFGIEAQHPDDFVLRRIQTSADQVCGAIKLLREGLTCPPKSVEQYLETLCRNPMPQTAHALLEFVDLL